MLQNMGSNSIVGVYSLAYSFSNIMAVIWNALNNSWVPFYYDFTRNNKINEMKTHAKNYIELFTVLSIGFMLLTPEVFHVFANREFWGGTKLIPLLVCSNYFIFLYSFAVNFEFYSKKTKVIATGTVTSAICNIMLNIIMIPLWGMFGAALATVISYGFQYIFHHLCAKYFVNKGNYPFDLMFFFKGATSFFAFFIFCWITGNSLLILRWIMAILIGLFEVQRIFRRRALF
jgi:O-antigen/teichoic acid export membrane protein